MLFRPPLRQCTGFVGSLLKLARFDWAVPDYTTLCRRQWRKVHLGIDAQTLQIRAIAVTDSSIGDNTALPEIIGQIPEAEVIATVTGEGAFDIRNCYDTTVARGAIPCFPPRRNARISPGAKTAGIRARNETIRTAQRVGRTIWKQWSGYHLRSLVETKMYCFKQLGDKLMARTFDRQVAELHVRAALLNRFSMLPRPETVAVA